MSQDAIFVSGEGDRWFERNRQALARVSESGVDYPLGLIEEASIRPRSVLEVGCANGWRPAAIAQRYGSRAVGVDPSREAIEAGRAEFPGVDLRVGVASDLPVEAGEIFDLVIVNYVLCVVARESLMTSVAEIDRCVADGGYLLVGDFLPDSPTAVTYHHLPDAEVYTYKLDYAGIFLATALYETLRRDIHNHDNPDVAPSSDTRGAVTLMKKSLRDNYRVHDYKE